jgi:hypothetical protein
MRRKLTKSWFLMPPELQEKIEAERLITSGLMRSVIDQVLADPKRKFKLRETTDSIVAHLKLFPSGWGEWPQNSEDCLFIGSLLAAGLLQDLDEKLIEFPEEFIVFLEERCKEEGVETEDILLELFIESREE